MKIIEAGYTERPRAWREAIAVLREIKAEELIVFIEIKNNVPIVKISTNLPPERTQYTIMDKELLMDDGGVRSIETWRSIFNQRQQTLLGEMVQSQAIRISVLAVLTNFSEKTEKQKILALQDWGEEIKMEERIQAQLEALLSLTL